jgi:malignant T-cell-amplified sequence
MFKKFDPRSDVSTSTQIKTSVQRGIKSQLIASHPSISEEQLDALIPKKDLLVQYKVTSQMSSHLMLFAQRRQRSTSASSPADSDDEEVHSSSTLVDVPLLFQHRDGPILPTLKLVHQYPTLLFNQVTVDAGAIPFLLGGANVMCPGLTNPGGVLPADLDDAVGLEKGAGVVIYAHGKEYPLGVGVLTMSTKEM